MFGNMKFRNWIISAAFIAMLCPSINAQRVAVSHDPTIDFTLYRKYLLLESKNPSSFKICHHLAVEWFSANVAPRRSGAFCVDRIRQAITRTHGRCGRRSLQIISTTYEAQRLRLSFGALCSLLRIPLRILIEFFFAVLAAEVIGLSLIV